MTDAKALSKTIVVVDSDPEIRQLFVDTLGPQGYAVAEADSLESFFKSGGRTNSTTDIFAEEVALFFISLDMENNNGLKIVEWLQGCERWADVPVTVLASEENFGKVLPASYFGAHEYLVKGFDGRTLTRHVKKTLRDSHPAFDNGLPSVTFSLQDYLAKEISRAKRTQTPVSIMMGSFIGSSVSAANLSATLEGDIHWIQEAIETSRRTVRECDTIIQIGMFSLMAILPLTTKAGLDVIETRLHDNLRPLLRALKSTTSQEFALITAGACAPEEAEDWRTFVDLARVRLRVSIENRVEPSHKAA